MLRTGSKTRQNGGRTVGRQFDSGLAAAHLGYTVRRAQIALFQDLIDSFAEFGIRPGEYSVLWVLYDHPGLRQAEVAETLGIRRGNFAGLVDALERRGLAVRRARKGDGRSHALFLTAKGRKLTRELRKIGAQREIRVTERIGAKERARLISLLSRFTVTPPPRRWREP
jgi:DNA-binding MarR family transcriptional regulator